MENWKFQIRNARILSVRLVQIEVITGQPPVRTNARHFCTMPCVPTDRSRSIRILSLNSSGDPGELFMRARR